MKSLEVPTSMQRYESDAVFDDAAKTVTKLAGLALGVAPSAPAAPEPEDESPSANTCWTCGKSAGDGVRLQACSKCSELGLAPLHFCNKECLAASWKQHKLWHKMQLAELERV